MKNILAYLAARSAQLPTGENSRITKIADSDRFVLKFDGDTNQEAVFTIPYWPDLYQGTGTTKVDLQCYCEDAAGDVDFDVYVEAVSSGDAVDLDADSSYGAVNSTNDTTVPGTAGTLFDISVTLTDKDSVAVGDVVRVRIVRNAEDDTAGEIRLVGAVLYEEVTTYDLTGFSSVGFSGITFASGGSTIGAATATELGYLSGATSSIQTQITGSVTLTPANATRNIVIAGAASAKPLILRGAASQSANLLECQNTIQQVLASVSSTGAFSGTRYTSTIATGTSPLAVTSSTICANLNADFVDGLHSTQLIVTSPATAQNISSASNIVPLAIKHGSPGSTANLLEFKSATAGLLLASFDKSGIFNTSRINLIYNTNTLTYPYLTITVVNNQWNGGSNVFDIYDADTTTVVSGFTGNGSLFFNPKYTNTNIITTTPAMCTFKPGAGVFDNFITGLNSSGTVVFQLSCGGEIISTNDAFVPLRVRGNSGQTANLQNWYNYSGTAVAYVNATGAMVARGTIGADATLGFANARIGTNAGDSRLILDAGDTATVRQIYSSAGYFGFATASEGLLTFYGKTASFYANPTANQSVTVNIQNAADKGLVVKGYTSQTANLQEWQNSSGTVVLAVTRDGYLTNGSSQLQMFSNGVVQLIGAQSMAFGAEAGSVALRVGGKIAWSTDAVNTSADVAINRSAAGVLTLSNNSSGNGALILGAPTSGTVGLTVKGAASQSANLQEWQASDGNVRAFVNYNGDFQCNRSIRADQYSGLFCGTTEIYGSQIRKGGPDLGLQVPIIGVLTTAYSASTIPLVAQGYASQTANLFELQNSSTVSLSRFNKDGVFITHVNTAPADGDVSSSECGIWFDDTNGSATLRYKGKSADGTVISGGLAGGSVSNPFKLITTANGVTGSDGATASDGSDGTPGSVGSSPSLSNGGGAGGTSLGALAGSPGTGAVGGTGADSITSTNIIAFGSVFAGAGGNGGDAGAGGAGGLAGAGGNGGTGVDCDPDGIWYGGTGGIGGDSNGGTGGNGANGAAGGSAAFFGAGLGSLIYGLAYGGTGFSGTGGIVGETGGTATSGYPGGDASCFSHGISGPDGNDANGNSGGNGTQGYVGGWGYLSNDGNASIVFGKAVGGDGTDSVIGQDAYISINPDNSGSFAGGYVTGGANDQEAAIRVIGNGDIGGNFAFGRVIGTADLGATCIEASGIGSIALGYTQNGKILSSGHGSLAMGYAEAGFYISCSGTGSLCGGNANGADTSCTGDGAISWGQYMQMSATNSIAVGGNCVVAGTYNAVFGSAHVLNSQNYCFIAGNGNTISSSGDYNSVLGYQNTVSATACFVGGQQNSILSSGYYDSILGYGSSINGSYSCALGSGHAITNNYCAGLGTQTVLAGVNSIGIGTSCETTIAASYSVAIGGAVKTTNYGELAHCSSQVISNWNRGTAQTKQYTILARTTNATQTEMSINGTDRMILSDYCTWAFEVTISARRTDATGESAAYTFVGCVDRQSGLATVALVGTPTKTVIAEDSSAWDVDVSVDTSNGNLRFLVTGEGGKTIKWVGSVRITHVEN